MARYSRKSRRSGRGTGAASPYARPTNESNSVIRLYAADFPSIQFSALTPENIRTALNLTKIGTTFRLIAVCFQPVKDQAVNLEFSYGGSTFSLSGNSIKPARVRVPSKNYVAGQWWTVQQGVTAEFRVARPTLGAGDSTTALYTVTDVPGQVDNSVQYIDIAIRF